MFLSAYARVFVCVSHSQQINKAIGANITVYHTFRDEVDLYRVHWHFSLFISFFSLVLSHDFRWKCGGRCGQIIKRSMNRAPGPHDYWWNRHTRECGGKFVKIKKPPKNKEKQKNSPKRHKGTAKEKELKGGEEKRQPQSSLHRWFPTASATTASTSTSTSIFSPVNTTSPIPAPVPVPITKRAPPLISLIDSDED
jgi:hypothetical protein